MGEKQIPNTHGILKKTVFVTTEDSLGISEPSGNIFWSFRAIRKPERVSDSNKYRFFKSVDPRGFPMNSCGS